jgi:putative copper resistance protein D
MTPDRRTQHPIGSGAEVGSAVARVLLPVLALVVAVAAALALTVALTGGFDARVVERVLARLVLELAAAVVLGSLATVLLLLPADDRRRGRLLDVAAGAAGLWAIAAGSTAFLLYLGDAPALSAPSFGPGFVAFLADVDVGRIWLIAAIAAAMLTAALVAVRSTTGLAVLTPLAVLALLPVALQGGASGEPVAVERAAVTAEFVRLAGTSIWIGITAACVVLATPPTAVRRAASRSVLCGLLVLLALGIAAAPEVQGGAPSASVAARLVLTSAAVLVLGALRVRPASAPLRIELLLLGALAGTTAASAVVRTTDPQLPGRTAPAEILTGAPLPPIPSPARLALGWQPDALWLAVCVVLLVGYLGAVVALRRRGGTWPMGRVVSWLVGVVALAWLTSGGIARYQEVLISAHLAQHAALLLPVPLLLAGGAPVRLLDQVGRKDGTVPTVRGAALRARRSGLVRALARPVPAPLLAAVGFVALYATGELRWTLTSPVGAEWGAAQCLLTGSLLVAAVTSAPVRRSVAVAGTTTLLVLAAAGGVLFAGSSGLLLPDWFGAMGWGTDARLDQRGGAELAGGILVVSTAVLLLLALRRRDDVLRAAQRPLVHRPQEEVSA